ncbi:MAG: T9SS type A sorting domain-containing protein [Bacteroidetes bacterium]|nr:MAG: T9SS type A sorting domain-containing protein [Bacteroidota bacterium]
MKKALLLILLLGSHVNAQTTRVSTADGDFLNPLNWSPIGIPANGDNVTVNHNMTLSTDIYYTSGTITISASGSLMEDATDRNFWVDGTGKIVNHGVFKTHLFLASPNTTVHNFGTFASLDSVWTQTHLINLGQIEVFDLLNDETAKFTNEGMLAVLNDMNNQGLLINKAWGSIDLTNDFSNCNVQNLDAVVENEGIFCVGNNLSNCMGDTLRGSGHYYIGNAGSNLGVLAGSATFHTPSGSFAISGNIGANVTLTTGACALTVLNESQGVDEVYPNPTKGLINTSAVGTFKIYGLNGSIVLEGHTEGVIDITHLEEGVYLLEINDLRERIVKF